MNAAEVASFVLNCICSKEVSPLLLSRLGPVMNIYDGTGHNFQWLYDTLCMHFPCY